MNSVLLKVLAKFIIITKIDKLSLLFGRINTRISSEIVRLKLKSQHGVYIHPPFRIIGYNYIHLSGNFSSLSNLRIECLDKYNGETFYPNLEIGNNVNFNSDCHVGCINYIQIGDNVLVGSKVMIVDHSHGKSSELDIPPSKRQLYSKGPIIIGSNTWICENVCILPNVKIGSNCIIGAGAVVNIDVPDNSIAVGNPIRIIENKIYK